MLLLEPITYYKEILKHHKNSYLAEDDFQAIIGIDCEYIEGDKISNLERFFNSCKNSASKNSAKFAGLFGVLSYEMVYEFERIGAIKKSLYNFPKFYYANAKSYLHYDKISKIYSFYGEEMQIYENLENLQVQIYENSSSKKSNLYYKTLTNLSNEKARFHDMVKSAKEYIKNGDVFQVVVGEILALETNLASIDFYEALKVNNPSPYMFHFPTKYGDVVGSSPELVMQIKDDEIFVAPIAGTRKRGINANEDAILQKDLLSDEKELAEHKMLIDLARNDIGKFAKTSSIIVKKPMQVVLYESVMHIISEVYGKKRKDVSAFDVISTVFPAGTLSGTPKIRAMQIINELESSQRGIYGGGLGFWHFNGDVQMAILIRSAIFVSKNERNLNEKTNENSKVNLGENSSPNLDINLVYIGAGAGIVYDSIEANEYAEICNKRQSCVKVIKELCGGKL